MLIKPNKKPRLLWDGKTKMHAHEFTKNEKTDMTDETVVTLDYLYLAFCTRVFNMRASCPGLETLVASINISICFCYPRVFVDLVEAFCFYIGPLYFAANAMAFGSVASASSSEPFREAITYIATA